MVTGIDNNHPTSVRLKKEFLLTSCTVIRNVYIVRLRTALFRDREIHLEVTDPFPALVPSQFV